jgi:hypothetical protein
MIKMRFREMAVRDGDVIEIPGRILNKSVTAHVDLNRELHTVITWLEEVKE